MLVLILSIILLVVLFVVFYSVAATILKLIPSNRQTTLNADGIDIWVISNGAHTDICMPIRTEEIDWTEFIDTNSFKPSNFQYIAFGWGDRGFYLDTPSWAKLKPKTAFKALFKLSRTTMQVVLYDEIPEHCKWRKQLKVSPEQYRNMIQYVKDSFRYTQQGELVHIDFAGMPAYDSLNYNFYEAEGRYHFLKTCNVWVNNALKEGEVRTAIWTPFSKAIFHQLDKFYPDADHWMQHALSMPSPSRRQRIKNLLSKKIK